MYLLPAVFRKRKPNENKEIGQKASISERLVAALEKPVAHPLPDHLNSGFVRLAASFFHLPPRSFILPLRRCALRGAGRTLKLDRWSLRGAFSPTYPDYKMLRPEDDHSIGDCRCCHARVADRIDRDSFILRSRPDDDNTPILAGKKQSPIRSNR